MGAQTSRHMDNTRREEHHATVSSASSNSRPLTMLNEKSSEIYEDRLRINSRQSPPVETARQYSQPDHFSSHRNPSDELLTNAKSQDCILPSTSGSLRPDETFPPTKTEILPTHSSIDHPFHESLLPELSHKAPHESSSLDHQFNECSSSLHDDELYQWYSWPHDNNNNQSTDPIGPDSSDEDDPELSDLVAQLIEKQRTERKSGAISLSFPEWYSLGSKETLLKEKSMGTFQLIEREVNFIF